MSAYLGEPRRRMPRRPVVTVEEAAPAPEPESPPLPERSAERWAPAPEVAERRAASTESEPPDASSFDRLLARRANAQLDPEPWAPAPHVAAKRAEYLSEHPDVAAPSEAARLARLVERREVEVPDYVSSGWAPSADVAARRQEAIPDGALPTGDGDWSRLAGRREVGAERDAADPWAPSEEVRARRADTTGGPHLSPASPLDRLLGRRAAAEVEADPWAPSPAVAARRAAVAAEQDPELDVQPDAADVVERLARRREVD